MANFSLFDALDRLWDAFVEWLQDIGEDILEGVKPLAKEIAKGGGKLLLDAAYEAVKAAEETGGSGGDKFKAAQATVISKLEAEGIDVVLNAVNGAIEAAVAKLKQ